MQSYGGVMSGMSWRALCEVVLAWGFGMALSRCLLFSWNQDCKRHVKGLS